MPFCRNDTYVSSCDCHDKRQATNPAIRRQDSSNRIPLFINSFNEIPLFIELYRLLKLTGIECVVDNIQYSQSSKLRSVFRKDIALYALHDIE